MTKKLTKSKVDTTIALAKRKSGTTLDAIAKTLRVSKVAAGSLIADARRKGKRVKCKMGADGAGRYYV